MTFSPLWLGIAAMMAFATTLIHLFLGGRESVPPLLASDLPFVPKYTHYYCWHLVSLVLVAMTVLLALPIWVPSAWELAIAGILISASFALWSLLLIRVSRARSIWELPQWTLFGAISAVGTVAFGVAP